MAGGGKSAKGGSSGAHNAALDDDEDVMNRLYRKKIFGDWKRTRKPSRQHGPIIEYSRSPAPPKK